MSEKYFLGIDIGGTWIKGAITDQIFFQNQKHNEFKNLRIEKVKSPLNVNTTIFEFIKALKELISLFNIGSGKITYIGISTAGIVDYHGARVHKAASHLKVLKNKKWKTVLEDEFNCNVIIINDADAATIGLAFLGYLFGNKTIGIMPIGTGLGFTVWKNGRRWRPGKVLTLLGSIRTPEGSFDSIASASRLAELDKEKSLKNVLGGFLHQNERVQYINNLVNIINSATILYNLDEVIICGGLSEASFKCAYPLEEILNNHLKEFPSELDKQVKVVVAKEGNQLQIIGALALARAESISQSNKIVYSYNSIDSEKPYNSEIKLESMDTIDIIETMWQAENEAGNQLKTSLPIIAKIIDTVINKMKLGGRIIYVGAGTSGRIAAMDSIEIPCTFGLSEEKIITLIAGGISDASIEIESDFEEDASAVPEMLLLNIQQEDTVIGISASGTAYFIQSALAYAKSCGAVTVLIQTRKPQISLPFCDHVIPLNSGNEVIAGSTRLKAGTAMKKVLNIFSSTLMIRMGKVSGPYMVDMACINNKLIERAKMILSKLFRISEADAYKQLEINRFNLRNTIERINGRL